jgi:nicotinate-nucleotide adenylyltransferase
VARSERIGVYGGTFDPIHRTHLDIAAAAMRHAALDRVIFVVAARPPHKRHEVYAGAEDRYAMVCAALEGVPGFTASRIELDREGPSYTADTLRALHAAHPGAELYLIIGYDTLLDLPKWREPETVRGLAHLLVVPRPSTGALPPAGLEGAYDIVPFPQSADSSTEIRERLQAGGAPGVAVPEAVAALIAARGLYARR